ncbi:MAG: iron ABC transporter permease, partial [Treponema sp.]|nr:iron ABC transporter permease [Treponema sp.]
FIFCFFSFMIVLLFGSVGGTTLELAIYHAGRIELDFQKAAFLSLLETLSVLILLSLWEYAGKKSEHNDSVSLEKNYAVKNFSRKEFVFFIMLIFLIAVFFLLPLLSVFVSSFVSKKGALTLATWKSLFSARGFFTALRNTLVCAFFTATLCTATGFFYSSFLRFSPLRKNVLARLIPILPAAVSSVTIGIGMRAAFPHGTFLMLIASQTALSWPFAYRQIHPHVCAVPGNVIDSARLFSQNPLDAIFRIVLPYSKRGILSAFGLSFAISCGDATLPLVLGVHGFDTLSLFTYRLAGAYRFSQASASGLLLGVLCSLVFALSKINFKNRRKSSDTTRGYLV